MAPYMQLFDESALQFIDSSGANGKGGEKISPEKIFKLVDKYFAMLGKNIGVCQSL